MPKTIRLNPIHHFTIKIPKKEDIDFTDFMKFYKEPYLVLVNNATLSADNPLRFRKNLL